MIHSDSSSFDLRQIGNASARTAFPSNYLNPVAESHGLNSTYYLPANFISRKISKTDLPNWCITAHIPRYEFTQPSRQPGEAWAAGDPRAVVPGSLLSVHQCAIQISSCSTCATKQKRLGSSADKQQKKP